MIASLRIVAVVILATAVMCSCATNEKKVELHPPVVAQQPEVFNDVAKYVHSKLLDERFVTKDDYEPENYDYFREEIRWAVAGDFDGNGIDDLAALLVNKSQVVSLVVFHRSARGIRYYILDDDLGLLPTRNTLKLQPTDWASLSHADADEIEVKKLKHSGIVEEDLESCHRFLHYWEHGKYHSVYRGV